MYSRLPLPVRIRRFAYSLSVFLSISSSGVAKDIIIQDDFERLGPLSGSAPLPINETKTTWHDNMGAAGLSTKGSSVTLNKIDLASIWYDSSSIPENAVATLSADIKTDASWIALGFSASLNAFDPTQGAFASVWVQGDGTIKLNKGRSPDSIIVKNPDPARPVHIDISLDYTANGATFFINGNKAGEFSYRPLPFFNQIFIHGSEGSGHLSHLSFALEQAPRVAASPPALAAAAAATPSPNAPRVFFLSGDNESSFATQWLKDIAQATIVAGFAPQTITPADLVQKELPANAILVIHRRRDLLNAATGVMTYMREGKALWLAGADDFFTAGEGPQDTSEINRLLEGPPQHVDLLKMGPPPVFTWTEAGRNVIPVSSNTLPEARSAFLSENDSTMAAALPPWVRVTPFLELKYKANNWISQEDLFTGEAMVLLQHTGGPYKGARILYTGFTIGGKLFDSTNDWYQTLITGSLKTLAQPIDLSNVPALTLPTPRPSTQRGDFFTDPNVAFAPLNFDGPLMNQTFWEDLDLAGYTGFHTGIPWLAGEADPIKSINWVKLDDIMAQAKSHHKAVIIDPYSFLWFQGPAIAWGGPTHSIHNVDFHTHFMQVMQYLVERYKDNPSFVALFATPHTGYGIFNVDRSPESLQAWRTYLTTEKGWSLADINKRYSLSCASINDVPLPVDVAPGAFNSGPEWGDYIPFRLKAEMDFNCETIDKVRKIIPDLPILLRGGWFDVAINMVVASHYTNVAPHSESIESSSDVETYYRNQGIRYNVPYSAENGWSKIRGGPMRINFACFLLGGYNSYLYSFAGPIWALPELVDFARTEKVADTMRQTHASYGHSDLALMIGDTTLYSHFPQGWDASESMPRIEFTMEKLGFSYEAFSAQFPKWDNLRIVIDDGTNTVLTRETATELKDWITKGGTFIAYPDTGKIILEGDQGGLPAILGLDFQKAGSQPLGKGMVTILPAIPTENPGDQSALDRLFTDLKVRRDFQIEPYVSQASSTSQGKKYLVVANKDRSYLSGFFRESLLKNLDEKAKNFPITITPQFAFAKVRNISGEADPQVANGKIEMTLKAHDFSVLEFTLP